MVLRENIINMNDNNMNQGYSYGDGAPDNRAFGYGQPDGGVPQRPVPPKNYLIESLLVTAFCCVPFGVVGIVKAASVESRFAMGDYEGARKLSEDAKKWTMYGFWTGLIVGTLYILFIVVMVVVEKVL